MMKTLLLILLLSGCAGRAYYEVQPIETESGVICCEVKVDNTKNYKSLTVKVIKRPDGSLEFLLSEKDTDSHTESTAEIIRAVVE